MVDMHLRKDVLYVWCSFTMIFNLAYFFIDTTGKYLPLFSLLTNCIYLFVYLFMYIIDHQAEEAKEKAKEEKRQKKEDERKKKQAEKRKKKLEKMMSPRARFLVNTLVSLIVPPFVLYLCVLTFTFVSPSFLLFHLSHNIFLDRRKIYIGLVILLGLVVRWSYNYYLDLQQEIAALNNPAPPRDFAAEERITDPVQGEDY